MKIKAIILKSIPLLLLFSFFFGAYMEQAKGEAEIERDLALRLALVESNIDLGIKDNLDRMKGLATYIGLNTNFEVSEINYFVEEILKGDTTIINNIGVFEDTTAVYVYPYEENEAVNHLNLVEIPDFKEDALRVKEEFKTILTPPLEMVQGGIGIIIRLPILTMNKGYWGQIGYMMRYETVIESLGIEEDNYKYKIKQINKDDNKEYEIYDSGFNSKAINNSLTIELPSSYWKVSVSNTSWTDRLSITFWVLLVIGILLYYFSRKVIKDLEFSQFMTRGLIESSPDLVLLIDESETIIDCSTLMTDVLKLEKEMIIGQSLETLLINDSNYFDFLNEIRSKNSKENFSDLIIPLKVNDEEKFFSMRRTRMTHNRGYILSGHDVDVLEKQATEIKYISYHDALTGLYNRRFFEEELLRLDNTRYYPITLLVADLNGLKIVNDTFGHHAGDKMIKAAANILLEASRDTDIVARWGGDEFVCIFPNADEGSIQKIIVRIKELLNHQLEEYGELSLSFGYETKSSKDQNVIELFEIAEANMYKNKMSESEGYRGNMVKTILNTLFEKSPIDKEHSERVSILATELANAMKLKPSLVSDIKIIGLMHDVGKIVVPQAILDKVGKLDEEEWHQIQQHPAIGYRILSTSNEFAHIAKGVLHHHERMDGKGYPEGISGDIIPIEARVITVVDAYDAMTAHRSYRKGVLSEKDAAAELKKNMNTQFDGSIVKIFVTEILGLDWDLV